MKWSIDTENKLEYLKSGKSNVKSFSLGGLPWKRVERILYLSRRKIITSILLSLYG